MTKRLYYTDPLMAAIAARDFDVQLQSRNCEGELEMGGRGIEYYFDNQGKFNQVTREEDRYYVHPDSEHIFEPQEGDIVRVVHRDSGDTLYGERGTSRFGYIRNMVCPDHSFDRIIMRNDKLFPWPESLEV